MSAIDIAVPRIGGAESFRPDVYDDATGEPIQARGQPTVGYGCRCKQWSRELAVTVMRFQLGELEAQLLQHSWYVGSNDVRRSVFLEIAFNQGLIGLLRYPHMLSDAAAGNWIGAALQCTVSDPRLRARYAHLAELLEDGS